MTISDNVSFTAAYEAHEIVGEPDQIITSAYVIRDGWLRRIPLGTTTAEVQSALTPSSGITIHKQGSLLNRVTLTDAAAQAADVNGDGRIDISDMVQMTAALLGRSSVKPN